MATATESILVEGRLVHLDLGARTDAVPCRVLGFGGAGVVLAPLGAIPDETLPELHAGRSAYVVADEDGHVHALHAVVGHADAGEIQVAVTDAFRLGQRRRYSRAPLALAARVRARGGEWETVTRDISAGGLRVARTGAPGEAEDAVEVVVEAPAVGLRIEARADVVRRTPDDLSLRFAEIAEADATLLQQIALAYYRLPARD